MGHPKPFDLKYVGVGNEDCDKKNYQGMLSLSFLFLFSLFSKLSISMCFVFFVLNIIKYFHSFSLSISYVYKYKYKCYFVIYFNFLFSIMIFNLFIISTKLLVFNFLLVIFTLKSCFYKIFKLKLKNYKRLFRFIFFNLCELAHEVISSNIL